MLRMDVTPTLHIGKTPRPYRCLSTQALSPHQRRMMIDLAARSCEGLDARSYLESRLERYGAVTLWGDETELSAFQLIDRFEEEGSQFIYLGPLFSRGDACVKLLVSFAIRELDHHADSFVYFAAEFQSPDAMLMFKRLFFHSSIPHRGDSPLQAEDERILCLFALRLPHFGPIVFETLSTGGSETLFRPRPDFDPIVRLMANRGIDFTRGDSQVMLVTCDPSAASRRRLREDLESGILELANWKQTRHAMFARIQELGW